MTTAEGIHNILVDARACALEWIKVLPTNVDFRRFHENVCGEGFRAEMGLMKDTPGLGMMTQLRSCKGHEYLLAAARLLKDEGCGARFFLGGDGESRGMYEEEARRLGLLDRTVTFMGWRADVPEIMAGLDVLVIASTGTEGVPEVALQAMAIGLLVVGSDIGGVIEVLAPDGAGVIVPPRDPAVLVSGIRCLLRAPARREEMGRLGRECVRRWFSHDKMVDETLALYEEAISSRGGRR